MAAAARVFVGNLARACVRAGQLAALLVVPACINASALPPAGSAGAEALHQFSEEAY